jgi:hypothetical protein
MLHNRSVGRMLFEYPHDPRHSGGGHNTAAPLGLIFLQPEPRYHGAQGAQRLLLDSRISDASLRSSDVQGQRVLREVCKDREFSGSQSPCATPLRQSGLQASALRLGHGLHMSRIQTTQRQLSITMVWMPEDFHDKRGSGEHPTPHGFSVYSPHRPSEHWQVAFFQMDDYQEQPSVEQPNSTVPGSLWHRRAAAGARLPRHGQSLSLGHEPPTTATQHTKQ